MTANQQIENQIDTSLKTSALSHSFFKNNRKYDRKQKAEKSNKNHQKQPACFFRQNQSLQIKDIFEKTKDIVLEIKDIILEIKDISKKIIVMLIPKDNNSFV